MKRIHPFISVPPPDQFQFYLLTGRIILLVSILFLQFTYWQLKDVYDAPIVKYTGWGVSAFAIIVFGLSFVSSIVREYIYFFLLGLFYLLILSLILQVRFSYFDMHVVFTYIIISMLLCVFFHKKLQLATFQIYCLLLLLTTAAITPPKPESAIGSYIASFVLFHILLYLAMSFRIERGFSLRQQYAQYRHLFEKLNDGIMYVDTLGRIQLVNERLSHMSGYKEKELIGMHVENIIDHSDTFFSEKNKKNKGKQDETQLLQKNQQFMWVRINSVPMYSSKKKSQGHIAICSDISARKNAEINLLKYSEKLTETNKELEQFSYFASHDLKTPIHTISSLSQVLYKKFPEGTLMDQDAWNSIDLISGNTERMNKLVDALLVYSSSGVETINKVSLNMRAVVQDALDNLAGYIQASDAQINIKTLPNIYGDKIQMMRLVQNIIENALLYRKEESPVIDIFSRYEKENKSDIFVIRDNGIGIDKENHEQIFLMFQKLSRPESSGLGIGLAICKKIVENHGGEIWLESKVQNGTSVYFSIPRSQ